MKFIDAHIHLCDPEYSEIIEKIIEDAKNNNVIALVSNSMDYKTSLKSLELAKKYNGLVFAALGVHPWGIETLPQNEIEATIELISNLNQEDRRYVVAIGEIGLDITYTKKKGVKELQYEVFNKMLKLAEKLSLPVIIHSRGTSQEVAEVLTSYNLKKVLFHWFSRPISLLSKLIERGYYITEGPPVLYSKGIRENVKKVPIEHLLTETDGPVRFGGPFKGRLTTPAFIPLVVEEIAKLKKMNVEDAACQILKNFENFFGIKIS